MPDKKTIQEWFKPVSTLAPDQTSGISGKIALMSETPDAVAVLALAKDVDRFITGSTSLSPPVVKALREFHAKLSAPPPVPPRTPPRMSPTQGSLLPTTTASATSTITTSTIATTASSQPPRSPIVQSSLQGRVAMLSQVQLRTPGPTSSSPPSRTPPPPPPTGRPSPSSSAVGPNSSTGGSISPPTVSQTPRQLVSAHAKELNAMREFSCEDFQRFLNFANQDQLAEIERRFKEVKKDKARSADAARCNGTQAAADTNNRFTWFKIKTIGMEVLTCKAAICTSFALTSAYILCGKANTYRGPRIEIVSKPSHVFVIVGRAGGVYVGGTIPDFSHHAAEWGTEFIVVDAWMGSLGHDVIYIQTVNPFDVNFLNGLQCHWDSTDDLHD